MNALEQTLTLSLTNALTSSLQTYNISPVQNAGMSSTISNIAAEIAKEIVLSTAVQCNTNLNSIPLNVVGQYNPLDLVSQNRNASYVTGILNPVVQNPINDLITSIVSAKLNNLFLFNTPNSIQNLVNIGGLKTQLLVSLQPVISSSISQAIGSFTNSIFNKNVVTIPIVGNLQNLFAGVDSTTALQNYTLAYNNNQVTSLLGSLQNYNVMNQDNKDKLQVLQQGFVDPTATYPTKDYKGKPDTNKLATGEVQGTIVQTKNNNRMRGAKLPGGLSWSQPESAYKGQYPYNKVTQTESGHVIEVDDTPGAERLHVYHKSGTFIEIDANGSVTKRAFGSSYEIIDRNGYISIAGKADISINGACNIFVGNDANIEVEGDTNLTCHNDITATAGGTFNMSAVESFNIRSANVFIEADNDLHLKSNTSLRINSLNTLHANAVGNMFLTAADVYNKYLGTYYSEIAEDMHTKVTGDAYLTSDNFYGKFNSALYLESGGAQNLKATGKIKLTSADQIHFNSSGNAAEDSVEATTSQKAILANSASVGLMTGRKDITYIELADPLFLTLRDQYALTAEESGTSAEESQKAKDDAIRAGIIPKEKFEEVPVSSDSESPSTSTTTFIMPSEEVKKLTDAPDNFQLSPNFTLGMLSTKAAVTKNKVVAQRGLTFGEIVYNLQAVALNVCEPILKLYPNMYITSAFRLSTGSSSTSQHPLGMAVDLQFKGVSKKDYYDIAKALAKVINYDQLLLEYAASTNNPWIHVSVNVARRKNQVMTFNNHAKFSNGLTQLA